MSILLPVRRQDMLDRMLMNDAVNSDLRTWESMLSLWRMDFQTAILHDDS